MSAKTRTALSQWTIRKFVTAAQRAAAVESKAVKSGSAKLGGEFAQYTSCDGIAAAGGCGVAIVKVVCCATCADVRAPRSGQSLDMDEILEAMFPELGGGGFRCYTRPWLCSTQGSVTQG